MYYYYLGTYSCTKGPAGISGCVLHVTSNISSVFVQNPKCFLADAKEHHIYSETWWKQHHDLGLLFFRWNWDFLKVDEIINCSNQVNFYPDLPDFHQKPMDKERIFSIKQKNCFTKRKQSFAKVKPEPELNLTENLWSHMSTF
ncbi:hypothetical protein XENOCAPTIV_024941 [Xenoophorus captivus]|uniref:Uncharacterized protein n=1 Tax=Xenoophorus captivus TaxID=1517983 RepID=A0ABV0QTF8_9TELE